MAKLLLPQKRMWKVNAVRDESIEVQPQRHVIGKLLCQPYSRKSKIGFTTVLSLFSVEKTLRIKYCYPFLVSHLFCFKKNLIDEGEGKLKRI